MSRDWTVERQRDRRLREREFDRSERRLTWTRDNPATIDALAAGTLVAVPVEASAAMREAGHRAHTGDRGSGYYFDTTSIYRAMIAEQIQQQPTRAEP